MVGEDLKNINYDFRFPVIFTLFTYGIYASQIVATMYVDGTTGGRRMADILYYAYHVWLLLNVGYWCGWFQKKGIFAKNHLFSSIKRKINNHLFAWFATLSVLLVAVIGITEYKTLSTYRACVWLVKGYAKEYAQAWEERLDILNDNAIQEAYFDPLPGYEELIFYADFEQGENWINNACEAYYKKDHVGLK